MELQERTKTELEAVLNADPLEKYRELRKE